jgi:hypothetical protein
VKTLRKEIAIAAIILVFAGGSWFGLKKIRCKQRGAVFARRVESIRQDAHERLKIGTKKLDISQFFVEHGIPFEILESEAIATLRTSGCAPLGCGTDSAIIGVRVKLDAAGTVTGEPTVVGMYTDCL